MYQFQIDFVKKMQYYAVSQLRQNEDYVKLCECIGNDYNDLKANSEYLFHRKHKLKEFKLYTYHGRKKNDLPLSRSYE